MSERAKNPDERGALWLKAGQKGPYMTGEIDGQGVFCLPVKDGGENTRQPMWRVLKSKPKGERPGAAAHESAVSADDILF